MVAFRSRSSTVRPLWRRILATGAVVATIALALCLLTGTASPVSAAPIGQCNGEQNGGGTQVACTVIVTNYVTATGTLSGATPSTVVATRCVGASGPVSTLTCNTTTTVISATPVVVIQQCNGSGNGGGGTLRCNATITTYFAGAPADAIVAASMYGCIGSVITGTGAPGSCTPVNTSGVTSVTAATIGQCNGSGNGGTSVGFTCIGSSTSTTTATLPMNIDQCNGSGNGGGSLVICNATTSVVVAASVAPTPTPTSAPAAAATAIPTPTAAPVAVTIVVPTPVTGTPLPAQQTTVVPTPVNGPPVTTQQVTPTPIAPRPAQTGNADLDGTQDVSGLLMPMVLLLLIIGGSVTARTLIRVRAQR